MTTTMNAWARIRRPALMPLFMLAAMVRRRREYLEHC
jgi:hypothetical protein